jgi:hypothetical protein
VLSVSRGQHLFVEYDKQIAIRIPIEATSLGFRTQTAGSKLTYDALRELTALAEHYEVICQSTPKTVGKKRRSQPKKQSSTS